MSRGVTDMVTIVGRRGTPGVDAARDLLERNDIAHRWIDIERDPLASLLDPTALDGRRLPLVIFPDGTELEGIADYLELVPGRVDRTRAPGTWPRRAGAACWQRGRGFRRGPRRTSTTS